MVNTLEKLFICLSIFLLSLFRSTDVFAISNTVFATQDQIDNLSKQVEELKSGNYQTILNNYQLVSDKLNRYTDSLTLIASIFGVIIAIFTVFVGVNFYVTKKDFSEKLREINNYVLLAKQNAYLVAKLKDKTRNESKKVPLIVKDLQKIKQEMNQLLNKANKSKTKNFKEIENTVARIQETESKLSERLFNTVSNIQNMNSQASVIAGTIPTQSQYLDTRYINTTGKLFTVFDQCSKCGKTIEVDPNPNIVRLGPPLCKECQQKG